MKQYSVNTIQELIDKLQLITMNDYEFFSQVTSRGCNAQNYSIVEIKNVGIAYSNIMKKVNLKIISLR